jgi:hypothetical protein
MPWGKVIPVRIMLDRLALPTPPVLREDESCCATPSSPTSMTACAIPSIPGRGRRQPPDTDQRWNPPGTALLDTLTQWIKARTTPSCGSCDVGRGFSCETGYFMASSSSRQARSQRRQASAQTRQCGM